MNESPSSKRKRETLQVTLDNEIIRFFTERALNKGSNIHTELALWIEEQWQTNRL